MKRVFPRYVLSAIEAAIKASEATHLGEIRFAVEAALDPRALIGDLSARERAVEIFSQLKVWDTEHNNGVLIYLLLADRRVEIVADRGINNAVGQQGWDPICREMEKAFKQGEFERGAITGIQSIAAHLVRLYPASGANENELPDQVVLL